MDLFIESDCNSDSGCFRMQALLCGSYNDIYV